jgi:GntR family negative regulator for fad regulon and positive regulator of fabA
MESTGDVPLRPSQYVEHKLLTSILQGTYPPGSVLQDERSLAGRFGVTRPTLREALHRLAREGWLTIRHGRPTKVNNYWETGGITLLSTMARYSEYLPNGFVTHMLEVRSNLLPGVGVLAVRNSPEILLKYLGQAEVLADTPEALVDYDWGLQLMMARHSRNPIYVLMFNDFTSLFEKMASQYFRLQRARDTSRAYYLELYADIDSGGSAVERIIRQAMKESIEIWTALKKA